MLERLVRADEKETREGMGRAKVDHEEAGERVEEEEERKWREVEGKGMGRQEHERGRGGGRGQKFRS